MLDRLMMIAGFGGVISLLYGISMLSTPGRGFTRILERAAVGMILCFACYALLLPFGISVPQNPISALLAGYLGLPGVAFSAFVSLLP